MIRPQSGGPVDGALSVLGSQGTPLLEAPAGVLPAAIRTTLDTSVPGVSPADSASAHTPRRLALPYELLVQCPTAMPLEALLQMSVMWLVDRIPQATHGALILHDPTTGSLLLRAHHPIGEPAISLTSVKEAMATQTGVLWRRSAVEMSASDLPDPITSGIYVPLIWQDASLGVVCVHISQTDSTLTTDALDMSRAVAHYAALALAYHDVETRLRHATQLLSNFQKLVAPQASDWLQHHRGRIRLGGEFCNVTILFADMRGFTSLSATMSPEDVTDMLEQYFSRLVPISALHGGSIDKYVGDAILAVFDRKKTQYMSAIQAALEMQDSMREVNAKRTAEGKGIGQLGIGIHCGEVVRGFVGAPERMEFTVIGDPVNRASRYCDGAQPGQVLISPEVFAQVWEHVRTEPTTIVTKHEGVLSAYGVKAGEC